MSMRWKLKVSAFFFFLGGKMTTDDWEEAKSWQFNAKVWVSLTESFELQAKTRQFSSHFSHLQWVGVERSCTLYDASKRARRKMSQNSPNFPSRVSQKQPTSNNEKRSPSEIKNERGRQSQPDRLATNNFYRRKNIYLATCQIACHPCCWELDDVYCGRDCLIDSAWNLAKLIWFNYYLTFIHLYHWYVKHKSIKKSSFQHTITYTNSTPTHPQKPFKNFVFNSHSILTVFFSGGWKMTLHLTDDKSGKWQVP